MKIYVITKGEYSSYTIMAVAIKKDIAERIRKRVSDSWDEAIIEEYETDAWEDILSKGGLFNVFENENGVIKTYEENSSWTAGYWERRKKVSRDKRTGRLETYVVALDEEHALKIAEDLFAEFKYREAMGEMRK